MADSSGNSGQRKKTSGTGSKKSASKKSASQKPASQRSASQKSSEKSAPRKSQGAPRTEATRRPPGAEAANRAARELYELIGREVEGVVGLSRTDEGWTVQVEVLELSRVPSTTDVLGLYEVEVDDQGSLQGYRRLRRFTRGAPGEERE